MTALPRLALAFAAPAVRRSRRGARGRAHRAVHQRRRWWSATATSPSPKPSGSRPRAGRSAAASCAIFPPATRRPDGSRVEVGFTVQSVTRNGAVETYATESLANGVRVRIGSADRHAHQRPARVRHPLPHHAADRLLSRLRRTLLERHRQRLDLPHRPGRGAHHAAGGRAVQAERVLHRPAGRPGQGRDGGRAAAGPHRVPHHAAACRRAPASPSRPAGRRASSRRPTATRSRPATGSPTTS